MLTYFSQLIKKHISRKNFVIEFLFVIVIVVFTCWQAGYFSVGKYAAATGVWDFYKMKSFIDF